MSESKAHKTAKRKAAGKGGRIEVPLPSGKRLDAKTTKRATEIERSNSTRNLELAAKRLKESKAPQKVLQVPQPNMKAAAKAMRKINVSGTVKNLSGSKRQTVK